LGTPVTVNVTATLISKGSSGTTWQYIVTSPDSTTGSATGGVGTNTFIADGTLQFDNNGSLFNSTTPTVTIDRSGTGATPTLQFTMGFNKLTALAGTNSVLNLDTADGSAQGVLNSFSIQNDGTVVGGFSNGQKRDLAQVVLATFRNNQGLVNQGNNSYTPGPNSGLPAISAPGSSSAGTLIAGALELSNVDLSTEFVNLISASTGFSASSRIITTSNQLLQDLLQSTR
jgi:flagellar hook protein FlgE